MILGAGYGPLPLPPVMEALGHWNHLAQFLCPPQPPKPICGLNRSTELQALHSENLRHAAGLLPPSAP